MIQKLSPRNCGLFCFLVRHCLALFSTTKEKLLIMEKGIPQLDAMSLAQCHRGHIFRLMVLEIYKALIARRIASERLRMRIMVF